MQQLFIAQKAFILQDDRILLVQKSKDDPNQPGRWEVPGGRMAFGEEVDAQLIREVKEEVGLDVKPGKPFHIWQWRLKRHNSIGEEQDMQIVAVARICTALAAELTPANRVQDDFLGECRWVRLSDVLDYDLIPNMIPVVEMFLAQLREGRFPSMNGTAFNETSSSAQVG